MNQNLQSYVGRVKSYDRNWHWNNCVEYEWDLCWKVWKKLHHHEKSFSFRSEKKTLWNKVETCNRSANAPQKEKKNDQNIQIEGDMSLNFYYASSGEKFMNESERGVLRNRFPFDAIAFYSCSIEKKRDAKQNGRCFPMSRNFHRCRYTVNKFVETWAKWNTKVAFEKKSQTVSSCLNAMFSNVA